jgi:aspartate carbamoyltransferase catalytic subunit
MHDLISIRDLSNAGIEGLFELASEFSTAMRGRLDLAHDAVMAALFYEPSTRTRMSFEAAMLRLGGQVISMTDPSSSSAAKGETLADTVRIVESYTDLIVLRHPCEGAARVAADFAGIPVINAGDGPREHPTQTLLDLYTIFQEKGRLAGLTVALCGDLKHGRTVHSLVQALARFGAQIVCVAPPGLELPAAMRHALTAQFGLSCAQYPSLDAAPLDECDVLYVTRLQRERFADAEEFQRVRSCYQVTRQTLTRARRDAIVLHPLPRVDELDFALDGDPRAAYFRQAAYGVPVRMALIAALLGLRTVPGWQDATPSVGPVWSPDLLAEDFLCANRRCISSVEPGIPPAVQVGDNGARRCGYCEMLQEAECPAS